jgi:hypothetical protein
MAFGMEIIQSPQEHPQVYLEEWRRDLVARHALLELPKRFSHRLIDQARMLTLGPYGFETVEHDSHQAKTLVCWVCLKGPTYVSLMVCYVFIIEATDAYFQCHIAVGAPQPAAEKSLRVWAQLAQLSLTAKYAGYLEPTIL